MATVGFKGLMSILGLAYLCQRCLTAVHIRLEPEGTRLRIYSFFSNAPNIVHMSDIVIAAYGEAKHWAFVGPCIP